MENAIEDTDYVEKHRRNHLLTILSIWSPKINQLNINLHFLLLLLLMRRKIKILSITTYRFVPPRQPYWSTWERLRWKHKLKTILWLVSPICSTVKNRFLKKLFNLFFVLFSLKIKKRKQHTMKQK